MVAAAMVLLCVAAPVVAKRDNLTRISGGELLTGWPPFRLAITTTDQTQVIENEPQGDWRITPSMTADGREVASAKPKAGAPLRSRTDAQNLVVGVWSKANRRWTEYAALEVRSGTVAISADGAKLACVTRWRTDAPSRLRVLDLRSGKVTLGPEIFEDAGTDISWAPDNRRLAFDMGDNGTPVKANPTPLREIYVMDAESGAVRRIRKGVAPAWSPSGEWIAFLDYDPANDDTGRGPAAPRPNRVEVMRANGTDVRVLATYGRDEGLMLAPVWLPGSPAVLIQRWHDRGEGTVDGYRVDVATGQTERVYRGRTPVYAWIQR